MEKIETLNRFAVTAHRGLVVFALPAEIDTIAKLLGRATIQLSRDDALNLAAWLVVASELVDTLPVGANWEVNPERDAKADFEKLWQAVRST